MVNKLPEGWQELTLEQLTKNMVDGPFGSDLKKVHYTENREARIIQLSNIGEDGWKDDNVKYTTFSHANKLKRCIATYPNVIVAKMMPAGRAMLCPDKEAMYILSSDAVKIVVDEEIIMPEYFVYATKTSFFQEQIDIDTQGSTRQRTSIKKLRKNKLWVPQLEEQEKIVNTLSDIDKLIANLELQVEKDRNLKQAYYANLFSRTNHKELDDWRMVELGEYVQIYRGGSPRPIQDYLTADGINWIKIGDVGANDKYILATEEKIIPQGAAKSRQVHKGDLILSNSMSFGRPYILGIDGCIHDGWLVIQDYEKTFDRDYLYYVLGSNDTINQYIAMAAGSSVQNLNKDKVAKVMLPCPSLHEQKRIAEVLSDIDETTMKHQIQLQKYRVLKQGMMEQLLTGKIRL